MITAIDLYPHTGENNYFWAPSDYNPILESFGKIAVQVDQHDYQGDSWVLYDVDGKIGYLQFGWGSCSGCDALQACDSYADIDNLIDELRGSIQWFESIADALKFFTEHDWQGDWSFGEDQREFVTKSVEYLRSI